MQSLYSMIRKQRHFVAIFACALFLLLAWWGGLRTSFGLLLKILNEENLWSVAFLSIVQSFNLLFYGFFMPFIGWVLRKKPKIDFVILVAGIILIGSGLCFAAQSSTQQIFFLSYGVLFGLGMTFLSPTVFNALITRVFLPYRTILIGIASAGMGIAMLVLLPLIQAILKQSGWQNGLNLLGGFTFLGCLPLISLAFWSSRSLSKQPIASATGNKLRNNVEIPALFTKTYWILLAGMPALEFFTIQLFVTHLINLFIVNGISLGEATLMFSSVGAINVLGRVISGYLLSRSWVAEVAAINYCGLFLAILAAILLPYQPKVCAVMIICGLGTCWATIIPLSTETIVRAVGAANFPLVYGFAESMIGFLGAAGAAVGGISYERLGSYTASLLAALCCGVLSLWCYLKVFVKVNPK